MYKILLVDDETDILEIVRYNLESVGWIVQTACDGNEALKVLQTGFKPDLILLDVMMPGIDGVTLCKKLREDMGNTVLIALLTARGEDYSQIAGFEAGADDYITKPIRPNVLVSRLKALLKRSGGITRESGIVTDRERFIAIVDGNEVVLPKKEFFLLELLLSKPGRVFTREEIFDKVWGDDVVVGDRTIDVHIRKLREHIGEDKIVTIKGVGYKVE